MVTRVAAATTVPATAAAFTATLPTHAAGDRLLVSVLGKYETTTTPTISAGWTLIESGTGGTGTAGNDAGLVFTATYAKDATSSAETAPTVTPGATAPNSWTAIAVSYRPGTGKGWRDAIATSAPWIGGASDTNTASALTGAVTLTNQPTAGDAVCAFGVVPTDLGTAQGASTITGTGLSGGTTTADTYVENALGTDSASVHLSWAGFTGTTSGAITPSFVITSNTNHSGRVLVASLREKIAAPTGLTVTPISGSQLNVSWSTVTGATSYILERSANGTTGWASVYTGATASYSDTGRSSSTTYYYRVSASDGTLTSDPSSVVSGKTVMSLPFTEDFASGTWGNWTTTVSAGTVGTSFTVASGAGVIATGLAGANATSRAVLTDAPGATTDQGVLFSFIFSASGTPELDVILRGDGAWNSTASVREPLNGYRWMMDNSATASVAPAQVTAGVATADSQTTGTGSRVTRAAGTKYWFRAETVGTTARVRTWADGSVEPTTWSTSTSGTGSITAGKLQISTFNTTTSTVTLDDITYYDPNAASQTAGRVRTQGFWR